MLDVKTILSISALIIGVILVFKDNIAVYFNNALNKAVEPLKPNEVTVSVPASNTYVNKPVQDNYTRVDSSLQDLETLITTLDKSKDKEEIDYLIDTLGPKLIRRRLNQ